MFVLHEQSDVFVDAAAANHRGELLVLSVFGRDTSIQQLMARLHQPVAQGGVDRITLALAASNGDRAPKASLEALVGDAKRLQKITGRMPRTGLLGNLVHVWIYDPSVLELNHTERTGWLLQEAHAEIADDQVSLTWALIKDLSPIPLLDLWSEAVLDQVSATGGIRATPCAGRLQTTRIELPEDLATWVSTAIADGRLAVPGQTEQPLGLAA